MRFTQIFVLVFFTFISFNLQAQDMHPAYAAVMGAGEAFDNRDADAFASFFAEDAVLVSPGGHVVNGKEGVYQAHKHLFTQLPAVEEEQEETMVPGVHYELNDSLVFGVMTVTDSEGTMTFGMLVEKGADDNWLIKSIQMTPVKSKDKG